MVVTIKDIAKIAAVSHSTVSRALRESPLVSIETRERIKKVAEELGYLPSVAARSLKTNQSKAIGVIVSNVDDPFFSEILQGVEEAAQESGYSLFIAASQRDPMREQSIVRVMREHRVDGVIICSTSFSVEQSIRFSANDIPIVVVNNQSVEDHQYSIYHDDEDGSRQVTRHLIELGHQKIAYLGNSSSGRTTQDRLSGFRKELHERGVQIPEYYIHQVPGGYPEDAVPGLDYFLDLSERPTAVVCFNDMLAIGILKELHQAGIQVPAEISVTGFDNIIFSAYTNPPLTTFDQPKKFIGEEAARLLLGLLGSPSIQPIPSPINQILQGRLLVRKSTAPPPYIY